MGSIGRKLRCIFKSISNLSLSIHDKIELTDKNLDRSNEIFEREKGKIESPTLLIAAQFKTKNLFLNFVGQERLLPVTDDIKLKLQFINLFENGAINARPKTPFFIKYPGGIVSQHHGVVRIIEEGHKFEGITYNPAERHWSLNIPHLYEAGEEGDRCFGETERLFKPELAGTHQLIVKQLEGLQYADFHGMTERPYKIINGDWSGSFYVLSEGEFSTFKIIFFTLLVAGLTLFCALITLACQIISMIVC